MSGRSLHLRDGEWITNRKTDRRNPRLETGPVEHRLIFLLPQELRWSVSSGAHGSAVDVAPMGNVTVKSFDKDHAMASAAAFLQAVGKGHEFICIGAVLQSSGSGRSTCQLVLVNGGVLIWYGADKPKFFPAR